MRYLLLFSLPFFISFKTLDSKFRGMTTEDAKSYLEALSAKNAEIRKHVSTGSNNSKNKRGSALIGEIKRLRKIGMFKPEFGSEFGKIKTMERFSGFVEGNIKASTHPVRFKVDLVESVSFPLNSYLACTGSASAGKYNYRIVSRCNRLVTDEAEYEVDVSIKDKNLTDGIEADYVYTGEEEEILGSIFTTAASVMIESQKDRVLTSLGFATEPSAKNALLSGLSAGAANANNTIKKNNKSKYVLLAVQDRKEVVVEFNRSFNYEKE